MENQVGAAASYRPTESILFTAIFLIIFALPVHLMMIKILYKDCQHALPRHKIMISLTISDALQISAMSFTIIFREIICGSNQHEVKCNYIQMLAAFFATVTLIVSSLNIVSLSIERYISCIHSLYVYHILTTRRVVSVLSVQWATGIIIGAITTYLREVKLGGKEPMIFQRSTVLTVFPSATIIMVLQLRLLHFSRSKLATIKPGGASGNQAEMADFRKKQVKVTIVASIVAIAYITCMFPLAILYCWEWHYGQMNNGLSKSVFISMAMLNALIDPLIYGMGIRETRKIMWKNVKQIKDFFLLPILSFRGTYSISRGHAR